VRRIQERSRRHCAERSDAAIQLRLSSPFSRIGAKIGRLIDAIRVMPGLVQPCAGYPRREAARRFQNFNVLLGARRLHSLEPASYIPAWMAGTRPAMTEPLRFQGQASLPPMRESGYPRAAARRVPAGSKHASCCPWIPAFAGMTVHATLSHPSPRGASLAAASKASRSAWRSPM